MKNIQSSKYLILFILVFFMYQSNAQDCNPYVNLEQGHSFELSSYDKKSKLQSTAAYEIVGVSSEGNRYSAEINSTVLDKKGKELFSGSYVVSCEDGIYYLDVSDLIDKEMLKNYKEMELEVSGELYELPSGLKAGQSLPDANTEIKVKSSGIKLISIKAVLTNRKVEGFETVETPAGSFECVKMSFDQEIKSGFVKKKYRVEEYFAKGIGLVKSELYGKKGKLESYTELTKLN